MQKKMEMSVKIKQKKLPQEDATSILDKVCAIWNELLKGREIQFVPERRSMELTSTNGSSYDLIDGSDGERTIFYILGQCMLCEKNSLIVIDEPDLYINESILNSLYNRIEMKRADCAFIYITHNLNFASSRAGLKYGIYEYKKMLSPNGSVSNQEEKWDIEKLPDGSEIPEKVFASICGSRRNILFVEGDEGSWERVYAYVYKDFTVIPVGSCEQVIQYTKSINKNKQFHRVKCFGIVDRDNRNSREHSRLKRKGIYCLDFAILENVFLIPDVAEWLYDSLGSIYHREEYIEKIINSINNNRDWMAKNIKDKLYKDIETNVNNLPSKLELLSKESINFQSIRERVDQVTKSTDEIMNTGKDR